MPELSLHTWIICAGLLGLVMGSFLNVVIVRLPARMAALWKREAHELLDADIDATHTLPPGIVRQRSHCPACKHPLSILENIPLLSWLLLRGRCRDCKQRISLQYPLVELLSGILSAVVVWHFHMTWTALATLGFTWALIALAGIDIRTQLLPDQITLPLLWIGLLLSLLPMFVAPPGAIVGASVGYLSLWSVYWLFKLLTGKEGMGHGDFKLLAALGAWMGPLALLPIILLASMSGTLIGGSLLLVRQQSRHKPIPFGPFIAAAGWFWLISGGSLLHVFLTLTGLP